VVSGYGSVGFFYTETRKRKKDWVSIKVRKVKVLGILLPGERVWHSASNQCLRFS
jgi:hypothetical protein